MDAYGFQVSIGVVLRRARREQGMLLATVSRRAGISVGHLCEIERGAKRAGSEVLTAICQGLGLPMSVLMSEASIELELMEMEVPLEAAA